MSISSVFYLVFFFTEYSFIYYEYSCLSNILEFFIPRTHNIRCNQDGVQYMYF